MVRRTKAEAQETRERIIDAAERVFHDKGVSRTSLNDIAKEAGVTRGAIYWHFKNKHDVFAAMFERQRLPMESMANRAEDPNETDPLGKFREAMIYVLCQTVLDPGRRRVFEIMFHKCEFTAETDPLMERQREAFLDGSERTRRTFRNAIARGQLPASLDIERAVVQLHVQMTGLLYVWLLLPEAFDLQAEAANFVDCYINSLTHCPSIAGP
ncbi:TetR family transcriptional regulator [Alloalcanivorax mobilis]|uniref:TetR family transcriptional regulator n=1 Tax=Alloalcanivorax mobilis TaxID=2019569 RepID=UPI000B5B1820|nr:TetR family transcriptional regulator [Alloalcanivorax mobilis]ASK33586.1 TetR family transcriptional regulator [Alcanivorax sp. N3-2A]|tara:strand:+ start:34732 stop:35367 length:636 start_codon:yes stop_codon:yes gene_type:complete